MDTHSIQAAGIRATIRADGAELSSLQDGSGREFLWQAGAAWPRHAPVLFPIVGRLAGDTLRHGGQSYRMTQHGFARDRRFSWAQQDEAACRLVLQDDEATRAAFPFAFRLELAYQVTGNTLTQTFTVANPATEVLPVSFGAHPAFIWPLAPGVAKDAHTLTFEAPEPEPIRRVAGGLLQPEPEPSPIADRVLPLHETLFAADAVILPAPYSRSVRYGAPGAPGLIVAWDGFVELGIWSKPGADFLCIEPWRGHASPKDFDGEFSDKPGIVHVPPGQSLTARLQVTLAA